MRCSTSHTTTKLAEQAAAAANAAAACHRFRVAELEPFALFAGREGLAVLRRLADETGRKLVGTVCGLVPQELLVAMGALPVRLCGGEPPEAGREHLPRDICPVAAAALQPLQNGLLDAAVIPLSCDWKAHLRDLAPTDTPIWLLDVPRDGDARLAASALQHLAAELEDFTDVSLTRAGYEAACEQTTAAEQALRELYALRQRAEPLLTAEEAMLVNDSALRADLPGWTAAVRALAAALRRDGCPLVPPLGPRVALAGSPIIYPNTKLPRLLAECRAVVVCEAFCGRAAALLGAVGTPNRGPAALRCRARVPPRARAGGAWKPRPTGLVRPFGTRRVAHGRREAILSPVEGRLPRRATRALGEPRSDLYEEMAARMARLCACGFGGQSAGAWDDAVSLARAFGADAVVVHILKGCAPFHADGERLASALRQEGLATLVVETDHGAEDVEGLRTRLEAFVRMIAAHQLAVVSRQSSAANRRPRAGG